MRWDTVMALVWTLFGGWFLAIETIEETRERHNKPGMRYIRKHRRKWRLLLMQWGIWAFGIAVILTWKGNA